MSNIGGGGGGGGGDTQILTVDDGSRNHSRGVTMAESSVICKKERSGMEEKVAVSGAEGTTTNKPVCS